MHEGWNILGGLTQLLIISVIHLLVLDKFSLIGEEPQYSWLLRIFQLGKETLGSCHSVLLGCLGHKLSSPFHLRFVTEVFMNHTSDGSFINVLLPVQCPYRLPKILVDFPLDIADNFRRPNNV